MFSAQRKLEDVAREPIYLLKRTAFYEVTREDKALQNDKKDGKYYEL